MSVFQKLYRYILANRAESLLLVVLLALAGIAHGFNMFHYPYLENDEATYVTQGWSFITHAQLAPYTYWYDHAPGGWIFLSLWLKLAGGIHAFGGMIYSGRVFMLLLHMTSALILYFIALRLTHRRVAGVIAVILFSLSPLELYFGRRVLLDNIMTFWMLLSILLTVVAKGRMKFTLASAITFSIAILSKENAVVIAPALLYWLFTTGGKKHRKYLLTQWTLAVAGIVGIYFLYALLKGELFPAGTLLGGAHDHVSLLGSLQTQGSRGAFAWPWDPAGDFYHGVLDWLRIDWRIITAGAVATILGIIVAVRERSYRFVSLLLIFSWLFLARGKLVIVFYIVPILPLLALMIGMLVSYPQQWLGRIKYLPYIYPTAAVLLLLGWYSNIPLTSWKNDETSNQQLAVNWVISNVPENSTIVIDDYAYPPLRYDHNYVNADWIWKIEYDPQITGKIRGDWQNIQYILLTHEELKQIKSANFPLTKQALQHSELLASFTTGTTSYLNIPDFISTNGDWAQIYRVKSRERIITQDSWAALKSGFMQSYGQVIEPGSTVTSLQRQTNFMATALQERDADTFAGIYSWSRDHLQHRAEDKLLSSTWVSNPEGSGGVGESGADVAANANLAAELQRAASTWKRNDYSADASVILSDLWRQHAVNYGGKIFLAANKGTPTEPIYVPLSTLRTLASADPAHPWGQVAAGEYAVLTAQAITSPLLSPAFTVKPDGTLDVAANDVTEQSLQMVTADLATEVRVAKDARATALLKGISAYFDQHLPTGALYHRDGAAAGGASLGFAAVAAASSRVANGDGPLATTTYQRYLAPLYDSKAAFFRPTGNPSFQLAVSALLDLGDHNHIELVKRSR